MNALILALAVLAAVVVFAVVTAECGPGWYNELKDWTAALGPTIAIIGAVGLLGTSLEGMFTEVGAAL